MIGGFHSKVDRFYRQRLPTPGYDVFTDARFGAGTAAATTAPGFPANSPYAANLPYDIRQTAVFGEGTYDFSRRFAVTAGRPLLLVRGGRATSSRAACSPTSTHQTSATRTKSDGFSPRVIATYEVADDVRVNAQASKGFRLGGVNDPLNIPLCAGGAGGIDALTYGGSPDL